MTMLTARIDAATLTAFDSFAEGRGGRIAVLRQLVEQAARDNVDAPRVERRESAATNRVSLRFTEVENAVIEHLSRHFGLSMTIRRPTRGALELIHKPVQHTRC